MKIIKSGSDECSGYVEYVQGASLSNAREHCCKKIRLLCCRFTALASKRTRGAKNIGCFEPGTPLSRLPTFLLETASFKLWIGQPMARRAWCQGSLRFVSKCSIDIEGISGASLGNTPPRRRAANARHSTSFTWRWVAAAAAWRCGKWRVPMLELAPHAGASPPAPLAALHPPAQTPSCRASL